MKTVVPGYFEHLAPKIASSEFLLKTGVVSLTDRKLFSCLSVVYSTELFKFNEEFKRINTFLNKFIKYHYV